MRIQKSDQKRWRGLAAISAGVTLTVVLLYLLPIILLERQNEFLDRHPIIRSALERVLLVFPKAENALTDQLHVYGRKAVVPPEVIFLAIDQSAAQARDLMQDERENISPELATIDRGFPWPRAFYPVLVERLLRAGAKVVTFDILLPGEKEGDDEFRAALEKYGGRVVLGSNLLDGDTLLGTRNTYQLPSESLIPYRAEAQDDPRVGFVNFKPDFDGVVRQARFRTIPIEYFGTAAGSEGDREILSLTARTALNAGYGGRVPPGRDTYMFRYIVDPAHFSIRDIFLPGQWEHTFRGGKLFEGKIVFVGPYGNWSKDELITPFGPVLGPAIHLSALNALLHQDFLARPPVVISIVILLLAGVVAVLVGGFVLGPLRRIVVLIAIAAAYVATAFALFNTAGLLLNLLAPTLALVGSGGIGLVWERILEQLEKARVRSTLERYVSKDVVKEVLDNPESYLHSGGKRLPITILFSDVRGFTTMTETADASKLVEQLNEYFTEMVRVVFAHRGTLDKFIGDAVMAHWGGIETVSRGQGPDACRAVGAALDMLKALEKLNARWREQGVQELHIGLGINHGEAICGHIGSEEKHEFTAIGDAVNLASRLEGATKEFHQDLLLGEQVGALVKGEFILRTVDLLQVKGKTRPVETYTVVAEGNGVPEPEWLRQYEEGVRLYRQRAFAEAVACFAEVEQKIPGDWLCQEYQRRCRAYQEAPPPANWDGAYVMTRK